MFSLGILKLVIVSVGHMIWTASDILSNHIQGSKSTAISEK